MIQHEDHDGVVVLRLAHGPVNAFDTNLFDAVSDQFDRLESQDHRAVVLAGAGRAFSAGVDLQQVIDGGEDYLRAFLPALASTLQRLFVHHRPVVAALHGHAIAGGCVLAACADRRVMVAEGARIGISELTVGVPFPVAALEPMRFLLPTTVLQDLVYSGRLLEPEEALRVGLVDELAPSDEVFNRSVAAAQRLAAIPDDAFALTKRHLRREAIQAMRERSLELDAEVFDLWRRPETIDRLRAALASLRR
ncbi:MAG: enoyl-CoA hydratase/isomerase family protein [Acidobacteriota bacterium]